MKKPIMDIEDNEFGLRIQENMGCSLFYKLDPASEIIYIDPRQLQHMGQLCMQLGQLCIQAFEQWSEANRTVGGISEAGHGRDGAG